MKQLGVTVQSARVSYSFKLDDIGHVFCISAASQYCHGLSTVRVKGLV